MFTNSKLTSAIRLAAAIGAASATVFSASSIAQESESSSVERIAVTGSSIQRIDAEGALPITTVTADMIEKSGVTSVAELIQTMPVMQGMVAQSESVGGSGGGTATAALKGLEDTYTLTLLNGKRMAGIRSGSSVDINSIPLAAIERVEILTDGASAVYGSDAIAGVVNFILKKDIQETTFTARMDAPEHGGAEASQFTLTSGYGDLDKDGFNVFASFTHNKKKKLKSAERDFAKTGFVPVTIDGVDLIARNFSPNAIPANANVTYKVKNADGDYLYENYIVNADDPTIGTWEAAEDNVPAVGDENTDWRHKTATTSLNPYRLINGQCATANLPMDPTRCGFDYTSTLEIMPATEVNNLLAGGTFKLSEDAELYSTVSYTQNTVTARIAPYPTGGFPIDLGTPVVTGDLTDALTQLMATSPVEVNDVEQDVLAEMTKVTSQWRVLPGGNRTNTYDSETFYVDLGIRGGVNDLAYDVSMTYSNRVQEDFIETGYPLNTEIRSLLKSGTLPLYRPIAEWSEEEVQQVSSIMFTGVDTTDEDTTFSLEARASLPIYELEHGDVYLGFGADYRQQEFSQTTSSDNKLETIMFRSADPEYDMSRDRWAIFAESVIPLTEHLEVTVAGRYDSFSGVDATSKVWNNPTPGQVSDTDPYTVETGTVGETTSDFTYKTSLAYRPMDEILMRASIGTGFRVPSMLAIAQPRIEWGVTSSSYGCTYAAGDPRAANCDTTDWQWDVYRQGNRQLAPEYSDQVSMGIVVSPTESFNMSVDYWDIQLRDLARMVTQDQIVNDPITYDYLHTTRFDEGQDRDLAAIIETSVNVAESRTSGIDYRFEFKNEFGEVDMMTVLSGTRIFVSEEQNVANPNKYDTSLGLMGPDESVVFEDQINLLNTISHGNFVHTVNVMYKSGWLDAEFGNYLLASDLEPSDVSTQLAVDNYVKVDYNVTYAIDSGMTVGLGINNLLDQEPPLSLGYPGGHQVGYNARYYDATMRSVYATFSYQF